MIRLLILLAVLFAIALGFHRLKQTSGQVSLTLGDTAYAVDLTTAALGLIAAIAAALIVIWVIRAILRAPHRFSRGWRKRRAEKGRVAVSRGLIAVAGGDVRTAERAVADLSRRSPDMPLARLLQAQTALMKGDREAARRTFQEMTEDPETRLVGLRGLYVEAEKEGELEAARLIADRAHEENPGAAWAARALLRHQTASGDWRAALSTLSGAADGRVLDKPTARRHRAVILTAQAMQQEDNDPDGARQAASEAHELAPDLAPAAVIAGRLLSRQGDIRRATRVLEATWKAAPHPDLADAYLHVRAGDSAADRLRRAETLFRMRSDSDVGRLAVARAAIDARDFARAREILTPVLTTRPTQRVLILMGELEEAETGNRGRAREWLARAVRAPRDPVWTADGAILEAWAPASPVTGRLDAVEWKVPVAEIAGPGMSIDAADLLAPPQPAEEEEPEHGATVVQSVMESAAPATFRPDGAGPDANAAAAPLAGPTAPVGAAANDWSEPAGETAPSIAPEHPEPEGPELPVTAAPLSSAAGDGPDPEEEPLPPIPDDPGVEEVVESGDRRRFRVF